MRRRALHAPHPFGHINVTPLIDVVMVMIVFYLIVGKLAADRRAELRLPESRAGSDEQARGTLVINVLPGVAGGPARVEVADTQVPPDLLGAVIRERLAAEPGAAVQIRAARELPYGAVAPVVAACRDAGVTTLRLATERAS